MVNPYARELTFPDSLTRTRRDHTKYLTLIRDDRAAAPAPAPDQRQPRSGRPDHRVHRSRRRETSSWPTGWLIEVLGRSLDELPPQTRRLLLLIDEMVTARMRAAEDGASGFSSLAAATCAPRTGWGDTQLKRASAPAAKSWNICWCIAAGAARASFTSCCSSRRADRQPFPGPAIPEARIHIYDGNVAGLESGNAARSRGPKRGVRGRCAGAPEPITTDIRSDFPVYSAENHW